MSSPDVNRHAEFADTPIEPIDEVATIDEELCFELQVPWEVDLSQ